MTLVMKFGGTSVGSAQAIRETAELILNAKKEWGSVVVVASAMGTKPVKVTDLLLTGANTALTGDSETYKRTAEQLRQVHYETIDALLAPEGERQIVLAENNLFIERFESICEAILVLRELTPRALDIVGGMGEQMSVRILAAYLRQLGHKAEAVDATELIVTDSNFQNASPDFAQTMPKTQARLQPILDEGGIPVVTGFIAANENGTTTTLGRGGSDFSGAILGQCLNAQEVWVWTDVDGVMTADPRIVENAKSIPILSYREVSELAFYGAKVLHPKTMRPCVENNIPLRIKNTFNPDHPGTIIVPDNGCMNGGVKAVTSIKHLSLITVEGKGMLGIPGIAARTFGAVAKSNVSVLLISQASSEQSICFATPEPISDVVIQGLEAEFAEEIARQDIDRVWAIHDVSIVTVVGAGMRGTPGISGSLFTALGNNGVNIIAIAQGSSECSISLVIDGRETANAVSHIHEVIVS
ncbi:MAG: aspartate kinase [Chloroflexi bacterium]|nr:MAG: aspartate kinase [Chloroflexota bacterium]